MTDREVICQEIESIRKEYDIDTTPIVKNVGRRSWKNC